jgi:hypothetical protein
MSGGRTIADSSIFDGTWVRLHGNAADNTLSGGDCRSEDGNPTRLLEPSEVDLNRGVTPGLHPQGPEIAPAPWHLVEWPAEERQRITDEAKSRTVPHDHQGRIAAWELKWKPARASLDLVCPDDLHWWIREENGSRSYRALFRQNHVDYDLALADESWREQLANEPAGIYRHAECVPAEAETWLTIGLSEPVLGFHYKIVAGVCVQEQACAQSAFRQSHEIRRKIS